MNKNTQELNYKIMKRINNKCIEQVEYIKKLKKILTEQDVLASHVLEYI